jgi:hypothetical protein
MIAHAKKDLELLLPRVMFHFERKSLSYNQGFRQKVWTLNGTP